MDVALQRRVLTAFEAALDLPPAERDAWIAQETANDPAFETALRRMLAADARAGRLLPTEPPEPLPADERPPPERVGPYRLTSLLGRGGMSSVWLGERDDGLFEQSVAVKVMSAGVFAGTMRSLFDRERQVMARLRHPNIGQIYDGGVDTDGAPWFVMERLEGAAVDDHVAARGLDERAIAGLFLDVCAAVRHAHQNLVVHADIKPSNVMVDGEGRVKLLDFGIARILEDTAEGPAPALPMTPAYASPARLAGEPPTPADDVYALGALLHDLLTGVRPGGGPRPVPSTVRPALRGDLDAIVLKATAADPARRYASVEALAADLTRYLERRPVEARGRDWRLASGRYVQRHPWAVAAAAAAMLALIAGSATITGLYLRAEEARARADQRFAEVRGLANYLLFDVNRDLAERPQTLALRREMVERGQAYLDRLAADPHAPPGVRLEAANGLVRLAGLQWSAGRASLDAPAAARANLQRAEVILADLEATDPEDSAVWDAAARLNLARVVLLAQADGALGKADRALEGARIAIARLRALPDGAPAARERDLEWTQRAAELRQWQGRYAESIVFGRRYVAAYRALPHPDTAARLQLANGWDVLAESTYYGGDIPGSVDPYRQELAVMMALAAEQPDNPLVLRTLVRARWALGTTLLSLPGRGEEARQVLDLAQAPMQRVLAFDASDEAARRMNRILQLARAQALAATRHGEEAIAVMQVLMAERRALARAPGASVEEMRAVAIGAAALGDIQADSGRRADACASYREGAALFETMRRKGGLSDLDRTQGLANLRKSIARTCG